MVNLTIRPNCQEFEYKAPSALTILLVCEAKQLNLSLQWYMADA
jgi:hypothetical protein